MPPAPASRPGSRLLADRLNPRPEIIPDQDQPARQPDDVPLGHRPDPWPAWHHQKRTGPSRVGLYTDHLVMHRPRGPNLSMTRPHVTADLCAYDHRLNGYAPLLIGRLHVGPGAGQIGQAL